MLAELSDEHTTCSICVNEFSCDKDSTNLEIRKRLPVLSSSQRCDHWFCHDCILREQQRVAEDNNGRVPKWVKCMICRENTSFNPAAPKYHRLLIDLLGRAQRYAAAQVKLEEQEKESIITQRGITMKMMEMEIKKLRIDFETEALKSLSEFIKSKRNKKKVVDMAGRQVEKALRNVAMEDLSKVLFEEMKVGEREPASKKARTDEE